MFLIEIIAFLRFNKRDHQLILMVFFTLSTVLLLSGLPFVAQAQQKSTHDAAAQEELKLLRDKIRLFETNLSDQHDKRVKQQQRLTEIEQEIAAFIKNRRKTERDLAKVSGGRSTLSQKFTNFSHQLENEKDAIRQWTRSGYVLGKQSFVKLLLTQAEPATLARTVTYYGYLTEAQGNRVAILAEDLKGLSQLDDALERTGSELAALRRKQEKNTQALERKRQQRHKMIARLNTDISESENTVERLRTDELRLLNLVRTLTLARRQAQAKRKKKREAQEAAERAAEKESKEVAEQANSTSEAVNTERRSETVASVSDPEPVPAAPFSTLKGNLSLPLQAVIRANFGDERPLSGTRWDGVMLDASDGQDFKAVADGTVVYADWFRGFGLLLIVDHGEGFMTLYSHGSEIIKNLGDRVTAREIIGKVGLTGGLDKPGLYFEIRRNGKPQDPLKWCKI